MTCCIILTPAESLQQHVLPVSDTCAESPEDYMQAQRGGRARIPEPGTFADCDFPSPDVTD